MPEQQHPNASLIERLYTGIKNADPNAIIDCYADDAYFEDIAFQLHGKRQIREMWQLVCHSRPKVTILSFSADDHRGSGRWKAQYMFGKTATKPGRPVDNTLDSEFTFRDGLIDRHHDRCDPMVWARQAYPPPISHIAGSIGPIRRYAAARKLDKFVNPEAYRFPKNLLGGVTRPIRRYMAGP